MYIIILYLLIMKAFRKIGNLFVCEECKNTFINCQQLSRHIYYYHNGQKDYYDKWLKEEGEGFCKICNKETLFISFKRKGYDNTCSKKCEHENRKNSVIISRKLKGKEIYEKYKQTCLKIYGVENTFQAEICKQKIKQIKKERYGDEKYQNWEKRKQTMKIKYGVENPAQIYDNISKNTGLKIKIKKYKNIFYQGSYELDFLEQYYNLYPNIQRGPSIKYQYEGKDKIYFPDFYIPSLNLIVEIKSSWTLKQDVKINEKKIATINKGFNYLIIVDKDYKNFKLFSRQYHFSNHNESCHRIR